MNKKVKDIQGDLAQLLYRLVQPFTFRHPFPILTWLALNFDLFLVSTLIFSWFQTGKLAGILLPNLAPSCRLKLLTS